MRKYAVLGVLVASTLCLPQPVAAQVEAVDLSIGYSFLSNDSLAINASSLPLGFFFDVDFQLTDSFSFAGAVSGHFNRGVMPSSSTELVVPPIPTEDFQAFSFNRPEDGWCSPRIELCEVHTQAISGVVGPRFHLGTGRARPFVHVMGGLTRSLRKIVFFAHTSTNLTIQPGGGVDVDMNDTTAFRIQADYRRVFFGETDQSDPGASLVSKDGADYSDFTFSIGVVFRLGR